MNSPGLEPQPIEMPHDNNDYAEDYERLKGDDVLPVTEAEIRSFGKLSLFSEDGFIVYKHKETYQPWFIAKNQQPAGKFEPYTQGYREEILQIRNLPQQRENIEFTGIKLKLTGDDAPISIDNGGSVSVQGKTVGFDFNVVTGDFSITTSLLPLGGISGNIYKYPDYGLDPELKPQLGPISIDPETYSFDVEILIPGLPLSPSILISGKLNQPAIREDFENIIAYDWFPLIGKLLKALDN